MIENQHKKDYGKNWKRNNTVHAELVSASRFVLMVIGNEIPKQARGDGQLQVIPLKMGI